MRLQVLPSQLEREGATVVATYLALLHEQAAAVAADLDGDGLNPAERAWYAQEAAG